MIVIRVYYCRAMDGVNNNIISKEYMLVKNLLYKKGHQLINDFNENNYERLPVTYENAQKVVDDNLSKLSQSEVVIVNISIVNHSYIGCIGEMIYAKQKGLQVIVVVGDSGNEKHFWTLYHSDNIVKELEEAINLL